MRISSVETTPPLLTPSVGLVPWSGIPVNASTAPTDYMREAARSLLEFAGSEAGLVAVRGSTSSEQRAWRSR